MLESCYVNETCSNDLHDESQGHPQAMSSKSIEMHAYGPGHEGAAVLLLGFAIKW